MTRGPERTGVSAWPITRRGFVGGAAALGAVLPGRWAFASRYNDAIGWQEVDTGLGQAKLARKPVFMVIHADWCPACRQYAQLFHNPAVVQKLRAFVPVLVDSDRDPAEARYRPDGDYIPRSLVLSPDGRHFAEVQGPYGARYFLPPNDPDYLIDYLDRGLQVATASGAATASSGPKRQAVPGATSDQRTPAVSRLTTGSGDTAGPKRLRAPKSAAPSQARADPDAASGAPAETTEPAAQGGGGVRGVLRKVIRLFL